MPFLKIFFDEKLLNVKPSDPTTLPPPHPPCICIWSDDFSETTYVISTSFLDGFGSHERVLEAHQMRRDANVDSGKEESNTSHASQAYDQFVA